MRRSECAREAEVVDALRTGTWPEQAPQSLREHVRSCASCTALAGLVAALLDDQRVLVSEARVPSSSFMWWRLQLRARREAAELAMQPIRAAQGLALAVALGLLGAVVGAFAPRPAWMAAWLPSAAGQWYSPAGLVLVMTGALLFVVAPVAIYFALSDR